MIRWTDWTSQCNAHKYHQQMEQRQDWGDITGASQRALDRDADVAVILCRNRRVCAAAHSNHTTKHDSQVTTSVTSHTYVWGQDWSSPASRCRIRRRRRRVSRWSCHPSELLASFSALCETIVERVLYWNHRAASQHHDDSSKIHSARNTTVKINYPRTITAGNKRALNLRATIEMQQFYWQVVRF